MQSKGVSKGESNIYAAHPVMYHEPWWNGAPKTIQVNASESSSVGQQSVDGQSQSEGGEDDDAAKKSPLHPDMDYGEQNQGFQQAVPNVQLGSNESLTQQRQQPELVGHSIAVAPNLYDPYYGGMIAAYGQPMVPQIYDIHQARMPLPLEMAQEPVFVNAKQYHGIMRRRESRAKAEIQKKLIKVRKPYLHESRHQHALRRARGSGGRFAKKSETEPLKASGSRSQSISSSSSGPNMLQAKGSEPQHNDADHSRPACPSPSREGRSSGQQWTNIPSNHILSM